MATIDFTTYFANLHNWQGDLLNAGGGDASWNGHGTDMTVTLGASSPFAGYVISIIGTGFNYVNNIPVEGDMTGLTITDKDGHTVLSVSGLAPGSLASDFSLFWSNAFGYDTPGGHSGSQWMNAWSNLMSGNDVFNGTSGSDYRGLVGHDGGNDVYNMLAGDDYVNGSMGSDTINGGDGFDTYAFGLTTEIVGAGISQGITVRMDLHTVVDCWGFTDHVFDVEFFIGSVTRDTFYGNDVENRFAGLRGNDVFYGGGGNDWVVYDQDASFGGMFGVTADLRVGIGSAGAPAHATDGFGNTDQLYSIENIAGTRFDDVFIGAKGQNNFAGGEGKDSYNGGGGADWIFFSWRFSDQAQTGIVVDLTRATGRIQNDGYGNVEEAVSIENINGSDQSDRIKGSAGQNWITGMDGADTMTGAGGADFFQFEQLSQFGDGDVITDFHAGAGANQDRLQIFTSNWGASTDLHLVNGTHATEAVGSFVYRQFNHTLYWDDDGTGSDAMVAVCVLKGVAALTAANFDLV